MLDSLTAGARVAEIASEEQLGISIQHEGHT